MLGAIMLQMAVYTSGRAANSLKLATSSNLHTTTQHEALTEHTHHVDESKLALTQSELVQPPTCPKEQHALCVPVHWLQHC